MCRRSDVVGLDFCRGQRFGLHGDGAARRGVAPYRIVILLRCDSSYISPIFGGGVPP
jgi:hypothetical protein